MNTRRQPTPLRSHPVLLVWKKPPGHHDRRDYKIAGALFVLETAMLGNIYVRR